MSLGKYGVPLIFAFTSSLLCSTQEAAAQESFPAKVVATVEQAIRDNPEVKAGREQFSQLLQGRSVEKGRYYPRLDAEAYAGYRWLKENYHGVPSRDIDYDEQRVRLSLLQNLYDGLGTTSSVAKTGHLAEAQRLDLLNTMENVALETLRAHLDVVRYRRTLERAQENLERHEKLWKLISARVERGVSHKVDLDLASTRLELARINVQTEKANLHDVSARYNRIVGHAPEPDMAMFKVDRRLLPGGVKEGLDRAYATHPGLRANVERIYAAKYGIEEQKARMRPTVDLVGSVEKSWGKDGRDGHERDAGIGLLVRYNLFRGYSDQAREQKAVHALAQAQDLRLLACRNLQQQYLVAWNDTRSLENQLKYLRERVKFAKRSRDNYYRQFRIGRRTLLDLLDQENEYYQAERTLISVETDLQIARARLLSAMGELTGDLGIQEMGPARVQDLEPPQGLELTSCPPAPDYFAER